MVAPGTSKPVASGAQAAAEAVWGTKATVAQTTATLSSSALRFFKLVSNLASVIVYKFGIHPCRGREIKSDETILNEKGLQPFKQRKNQGKNDVNSRFINLFVEKSRFLTILMKIS